MQLDTSMHEMESDESLLYSMDQNALTLRTMMLAECVSFDAGRNCVTVQPLLQTNIDGNVSNIPPIKDVPVGFYQAGGFVITHKPSPGDVCMLLISDRNISKWKLTGGIVDPKSSQHHNMNDAVAYFGLNAFPDAVGGVQDGIDVRSLDGSVSLHVNASSITAKIGDSAHTLSASNYSLSVGGANTMTATASGVNFGVPVTMPNGATINGIPFNTHKHTGVETGGGTSGGPTS